MNAKKSTSLIILSLASITLLASCGSGKEVKRADAETLLSNIISNTKAQTKLTLTSTASGDNSGNETDVIDLDNKFVNSYGTTTSSGTTTKVDTYMYLSNSVFYTVDAIAKTYTETDQALAAGAAWTVVSTAYSAVMTMTTTTASSALATLKSWDSSEPTDVTESYHSTGDGNVTLAISQKATSSTKASNGTTVFNNNLIVSNDATEGSNKTTAKFSWGSAKVAIPSLSGYTKK